jgi:DNA helicase HerA-like ATPase
VAEVRIKNLCKKLKPLLGKRADAIWTAYVTAETPRSKQEAEALIQLLAAQYLSANVADEPILLPPPSAEAAAGEFLLGTLRYGRTNLSPLYLRRENFIKHIGIFAITGGGKTNVSLPWVPDAQAGGTFQGSLGKRPELPQIA